jgi:hypothetical protein
MRSAAVMSLAIQLTCSAACFGQIKIALQDVSAKGSPFTCQESGCSTKTPPM